PDFPSRSIPEDPSIQIRVLVYRVPFSGIAPHTLHFDYGNRGYRWLYNVDRLEFVRSVGSSHIVV
ncbi:hypothetical protein Cadr_000007125, partial [Camelus dromedarius]